jgi:hypothetical protein
MGEIEETVGKGKDELSGPSKDKEVILNGLVGITADNPMDLEEARKERLARQ